MIEIKAVRYDWRNYSCYLGTLKYLDVPKLVKVTSNQAMNRTIDSDRVVSIVKYIETQLSNSFFPPVILNSSSKIDYDSVNGILKLKDKNLTIIDGQHRLSAINQIMSDNSYKILKESVISYQIPFLLIENLEFEMHRTLFSTINDYSENVEPTVIERFSTNEGNMFGLRYISENKQVMPLIEWEHNRSQDKIVYMHITRCITELNKSLREVLKDQLTGSNIELLYKDDIYFPIIKDYWDKIFNHIIIIEHHKDFWVKFITLMAITRVVCWNLENGAFITEKIINKSYSQCVENIRTKINELLDRYLLKDLLEEYKGTSRQGENTYKAIIECLETNISINGG